MRVLNREKAREGPRTQSHRLLAPWAVGEDRAGCVRESLLRWVDPPPAPRQNDGPHLMAGECCFQGPDELVFVFIMLVCFLFQKLWNVLDGAGSRLKRDGDAYPLWGLAESVSCNLRVTHRFLCGERRDKGKKNTGPRGFWSLFGVIVRSQIRPQQGGDLRGTGGPPTGRGPGHLRLPLGSSGAAAGQ